MIFLTGTDTGCGKTTVGRALAAAMVSRGLRVGVLKPVETGCERGAEGELLPADALALGRAAGLDLPVEELCPFRFSLAASPERAAAEAGAVVDIDRIRRAFEAMRARSDVVLVEGAGGLLVPVTADLTMAELASELDLPLVVVARDALGTVNHSLLTLEAVRRRGLELRGVVLSSTEESRPGLDNAAAIEAHGGAPVLGTLPFLRDADDGELGRAAFEHLELGSLLPRRE